VSAESNFQLFLGPPWERQRFSILVIHSSFLLGDTVAKLARDEGKKRLPASWTVNGIPAGAAECFYATGQHWWTSTQKASSTAVARTNKQQQPWFPEQYLHGVLFSIIILRSEQVFS